MTPHPPPPEGFESWIDWALHSSPRPRRVWNEDLLHARSELARLRRIEAAARDVDAIYAGSYHGTPFVTNCINDEMIEPAARFDALRAALEAKP